MPSAKEEKEIKFIKEVKDHSVVIMESGASRETAITETRIKYDLSLEELEKIVPHIEIEKVSKKVEGRFISKVGGTKVLVTK